MSKKYRVAISYEFTATDDVAAREYISLLHLDDKANLKLQEIYDHKPPRSIQLIRKQL